MMKIGGFDATTAREMVGHSRTLVLEAKARADADQGLFSPPNDSAPRTYWGQCQEEFDRIVYTHQYNTRLEKNSRKDVTASDAVRAVILNVLNTEEAVKSISEYKSGKTKALNALVGMVVRECKSTKMDVDISTISTELKQLL